MSKDFGIIIPQIKNISDYFNSSVKICNNYEIIFESILPRSYDYFIKNLNEKHKRSITQCLLHITKQN